MMSFFERRRTAYQAFVEKRMGDGSQPGLCGLSKEENPRTRLLLKYERGDPADPTGQWRKPFEVSTADDRGRACASVDE